MKQKWMFLPILCLALIAAGLIIAATGASQAKKAGSPPRQPLKNGSIITVEEFASYSVYHEYSYMPIVKPGLIFRFTNTVTKETVHSVFPARNDQYIEDGVAGRIIGTANLSPGSYRVDFDGLNNPDAVFALAKTMDMEGYVTGVTVVLCGCFLAGIAILGLLTLLIARIVAAKPKGYAKIEL